MNTSKNTIFLAFLLLTSFIEGGVVMAVELLGAKMIAPFFGTSLYIWSATLAITLLGLTIGYFLGGLLSSKTNSNNIIYYILLIASLLVGLMNINSFWILSTTIDLDIKSGSIISLITYLLPPLSFLGMTSPLIINGIYKYINNSGKSAGTVYAISTLGGILMTFIVGFTLIPIQGVSKTCFYYALLLCIVSSIYFLFIKNKKGTILSGLVLLIIILLNLSLFISNPTTSFGNKLSIKYKSEGLLGQITVLDNSSNRIISVNNMAQSAMHIPTKKARWKYIHRIATYASIKEKNSNTLICGLAGGLLVNEFIDLGFNVDVCEIDQRMEYVAKKYFYLKEGYKLFIDDARHYFKRSKKTYDIIVLDLSAGENVPANVYTYESFCEIKELLAEDGILFLHYLNEKNGEGKKAVQSIGNTMNKSGLKTTLLNTTSTDKNNTEIVYFSSKDNTFNLEDCNFPNSPSFSDSLFQIPKKGNIYDSFSFKGGELLTDDKPNIDIFHLSAALKNRGNIETYSKDIVEKIEVLYH
ncbi:fused MFS/spermidine synthase [Vicingaceae bacterium]|nr:fused MFS/spermidine synthase [Vicingaceae bacterium]